MPAVAVFAILIASIAAMPGNVLPVTLGLLGAEHGLDAATLGYLVAVNTFAGLVTSLSAPYWMPRVGLRRAAAVLLVLNALGLLGLARAPGLAALFAAQIGLGVAAVGIASICITLIAQLDNPARAYGVKITADVILAGTFLTLMPVGNLGLREFVLALAAPIVLALAMAPRLPATAYGPVSAGIRPAALRSAPGDAWQVLVILVVFYIAGVGIWPFVERFGLRAGLDPGTAANVIAAGLFVGMAGSLGAVASAGRMRGLWPQALCGGAFAASILWLAFARSTVSYAGAVFVFNAAWNFFIPFVIALLASRDTTRRLSALVPGTAMLGGIVGPPLAGNLIDAAGFGAAGWVMMLICAASIGGYLRVARRPAPPGR
jgi:MFS transporter, DHA1 family, inner membrane transport protein